MNCFFDLAREGPARSTKKSHIMDAWGEKYRWTTAFLVFEIAWENRIMTAPRIFCEMGQQLAERAEQMEETVMLSGVEKKANP